MSAAQLAGVPPAPAGTGAPAPAAGVIPLPAPAVPALALAPLPAELAALKANAAFMRAWTDGEPDAAARMSRLYTLAYDGAPAAVDARDPAPERAVYALPPVPDGLKLDHEAAAPLMAVAHAEGIGRAGFQVLAERAFALAGGETPHTAEEAGGELTSWFGEERGKEVLAAAQAVAARAMERDPRVREVLTALSTDPWAIAQLGEHQLRREGRR